MNHRCIIYHNTGLMWYSNPQQPTVWYRFLDNVFIIGQDIYDQETFLPPNWETAHP